MCLATSFFFFNDTATTEIYTLSLHDALPISFSEQSARSSTCAGPSKGPLARPSEQVLHHGEAILAGAVVMLHEADRKSTRLNSSHQIISYAVFCLKKKRSDGPPGNACSPALQ